MLEHIVSCIISKKWVSSPCSPEGHDAKCFQLFFAVWTDVSSAYSCLYICSIQIVCCVQLLYSVCLSTALPASHSNLHTILLKECSDHVQTDYEWQNNAGQKLQYTTVLCHPLTSFSLLDHSQGDHLKIAGTYYVYRYVKFWLKDAMIQCTAKCTLFESVDPLVNHIV